jgi:hypothetical protein
MGDSLSCDCMDPMVSARILKGLMWGKEDWEGKGEGVMAVQIFVQQQSVSRRIKSDEDFGEKA